MAKGPQHSETSIRLFPAANRKDFDSGADYAKACKQVHDSRIAFDTAKTKAEKLEVIGIDAICERVANCVTLQTIANDVGISKGSLITWLAKYADQYARAREAQAEQLAEDILKIADDCRIGQRKTEKANGDVETVTVDMVERARLQIDARKWLAGKMAPKKYGDKMELEHSGAVGIAGVIQKARDRAKSGK